MKLFLKGDKGGSVLLVLLQHQIEKGNDVVSVAKAEVRPAPGGDVAAEVESEHFIEGLPKGIDIVLDIMALH